MNGWLSMASQTLCKLSGHLLTIYDKVVDFYNQINLLYGSITEFCSPQSCPEMKASDEYIMPKPWMFCPILNAPRFEYLWQDSENYKRPTKMPAPEYIEHLMAWVQGNIDNESMFPSRIGEDT